MELVDTPGFHPGGYGFESRTVFNGSANISLGSATLVMFGYSLPELQTMLY